MDSIKYFTGIVTDFVLESYPEGYTEYIEDFVQDAWEEEEGLTRLLLDLESLGIDSKGLAERLIEWPY